MNKEIWKEIKDYEGLYQISNFGRVKSLPRKGTKPKEYILKTNKDKKGYLIYGLTKNGKTRNKKAHRLVAEAFIPNKLNKEQVNHIDGNKENNNVKNLEWVTGKENVIHAIKHNLIKTIPMQEAHKKEILQYELNGNYIKNWKSSIEASLYYKVKSKNINACCRGEQKTAYGYIWKYKEN